MPKGKGKRKAQPPVPPSSEQQAQAEGLVLRVADNKTGYAGVHLHTTGKPYEAKGRRGGKQVSLGTFATAEVAALCVARSLEGQEAAQRAAAAPPLTSEEARQQAQAEGLTLVVAENTTGYFGVHLNNPGQPKPYQAQVRRGGKMASLGCFATAEEAALCVARSPEGQAKERKAVANENAIRGVASITPRFALRRGYIEHARTDVPALATFTVRQSALRAVLP